MLLRRLAQTTQCFDLNLPHSLARKADLTADLFERTHLVAAQTKPPADHLTLLLGQVRQPVIDVAAQIVVDEAFCRIVLIDAAIVSSTDHSESANSGTSSEVTRSFSASMRLTSSTGFSSSSAISSAVGSWSSFWDSSRDARR